MPEVLASWPFFAGCRIFTTSISTLSHQIDPAMDSVFREIPAEFGNIQRIVMIPARRSRDTGFARDDHRTLGAPREGALHVSVIIQKRG